MTTNGTERKETVGDFLRALAVMVLLVAAFYAMTFAVAAYAEMR